MIELGTKMCWFNLCSEGTYRAHTVLKLYLNMLLLKVMYAIKKQSLDFVTIFCHITHNSELKSFKKFSKLFYTSFYNPQTFLFDLVAPTPKKSLQYSLSYILYASETLIGSFYKNLFDSLTKLLMLYHVWFIFWFSLYP